MLVHTYFTQNVMQYIKNRLKTEIHVYTTFWATLVYISTVDFQVNIKRAVCNNLNVLSIFNHF